MATTFPLFPRLPTELRLKIWLHALPLYPRVLELKPTRWNDCVFPDTTPSNGHALPKWTLSVSAIPTLLCVSREARCELLPWYDCRFAAKGVAASPECLAPWAVAFCPVTDTLYVNLKDSQEMLGALEDGIGPFLREVLRDDDGRGAELSLRKLAGSERFWGLSRDPGFLDSMKGLASLEQAVLVLSSRAMRIAIEGGYEECGMLHPAVAMRSLMDAVEKGRDRGIIETNVCLAGDLAM